MILDFYFRKPVLLDYLIAILITVLLFILYKNNLFNLPTTQDSYDLTGDLTNISLTMAGFILTILTVLITFKDTSNNKPTTEVNSTFNNFFSTDFYYETVKHLKNCIKSIVFIATIGFFIKLFFGLDYRKFFFFYNAFGLVIIVLTIWRCLIILSKILILQKEDK
ncbi:hypothetical protein [Apibacter adventoris]|uniref:Uncharacterized protein n=1 Tax=Apibacter adventoris TaxID=1679466 RepID=A0A2S8AAQ7_9FLAO|nr:hypothetical protein [Apibacter adventoris]PQL91669.1 hypothetical protein C4S77_07660 [Apibacter adventoris]